MSSLYFKRFKGQYLRVMRDLPTLKLNMLEKLPKNIDRRQRGLLKRSILKQEACPVTLPGTSKWSIPPFYLKIPQEPYYQGFEESRRYYELSFLRLQRLIDLGHLDCNKPIDLAKICNTGLMKLHLDQNYYGIILTDEGSNIFKAKIQIEVQKVLNEQCIAAIESNGGTLICRYYDPESLKAISDPEKWFMEGKPIPRCEIPPLSLFEYYTSPSTRGYMSTVADIEQERYRLSQKYGYVNQKIQQDVLSKDPRQIFYGLEPGWLINLRNKKIYKATNPEHVQYYKS